MKQFFIFSLLCFCASVSVYADFEPKQITTDLQRVYVPVGFDSNDQSEVTVAGVFPNTCHQVADYQIVNRDEMIESKVIRVRQKALVYDGYCLKVPMPFYNTIKLGVLPEGTYKIVDHKTGNSLGEIDVKEATDGSAGSDDYIYALIQDALVVRDGQTGYRLLLEGQHTHRCMYMKEIKVKYYEDVVIVQPIVDLHEKRDDCDNNAKRFTQTVPLETLEGNSYLFHIRSMNGQAINKVFDGLVN